MVFFRYLKGFKVILQEIKLHGCSKREINNYWWFG
jgi:hypothetical protein